MKTIPFLRLLALVLAVTTTALHAQVPQIINYQGLVAVGTPPVNFDGTGSFKFALVQGTGPTLLWKNDGSEGDTEPATAVTLTVAKGLYSVLLGDTTLGAGMTAIPATVFANPDVRLRVWFNDGTNGSQLISPDQRLAPNGYHSDGSIFSEALANAAVTSAKIQNGAVTNTQLAPNAVQAANIAAGAVGSTQIANTSIATTNLANGSVTAAKLGSDVGLWSVTGANVYRNGSVGIGTGPSGITRPLTITAPQGLCVGTETFVGTLASLTMSLSSANDGYADIQAVRSGGSLFPPRWGVIALNAFTGNVGIGTTTPNALLDLSSASQVGERLRLSGNDYAGAGTRSDGISFVLQRNIPQRADLFIGYSGALATGTANSGLRIIPGGNPASPQTNGVTIIDAISTDGSTFKDLGFNFDKIRILGSNGNVGIGTPTPTAKLEVGGAINLLDGGTKAFPGGLVTEAGARMINFGMNDSRFGTQTNTSQGGFLRVNTQGSVSNLFQFFARPTNGASLAEVVSITAAGNVGIGTTNPTKGALQIDSTNGVQPGYNPAGRLNTAGASSGSSGAGGNVSLWAAGWIFADTFLAFSDERIKDIKGQSDRAADLKTLLGIKITDYTFKDTISKGSRAQKKVIAQQVEQVYPQAVTRSTSEVPDIYKNATGKNGWVQLATDLKVGERVKLIGEKEQGVYEVLEVREGAFRTAFQPGTDKLFVFGREVNDFRSVDYEAIAMLNVSATQELARKLAVRDAEITRLAAENAALKKQLAENFARDKSLAERLARLENAIPSPATQPVKADANYSAR